ncbi:MAG: hypothetical protein EOP49_12910, partial [Sphingobacteriales bacterium]
MKIGAVCFMLLINIVIAAQQRPIKIALLNTHISAEELNAIRAGWKQMGEGELKTVSFADLASSTSGFTHVWYHRTDTAAIDAEEKKAGELFRRFVNNGGNLFLSMEAMPLLNEWNIEPAKIQFAQDTLK